IGWILAAWPFTFIFVNWDAVNAANPQGLVKWLEAVFSNPLTGDAAKAATKWTYIVAGLASLALAGFSFLLPHTPPKKAVAGAAGGQSSAWVQAVQLLKQPFVLVLWLVTLVDSFVHNCYFNWTGTFLGTPKADGGVGIAAPWITPIMSIGQVAEILTMFILGSTLKRLGWRATLIIGILGHALRFAVYAFLPQFPWLIVAVQVVHGICYAFYFATVYIFVDAYFPKDIRSSAHGLFNLQILGLGALAANSICPLLMECANGKGGSSALGSWLQSTLFRAAGATPDYRSLFLIPTFAALIAAMVLAVAFWPPRSVEAGAGDSAH
ncbi:MAG: MFS transporter, partial [Verrucomicrobiota bacterium]